MPERLVCFKNGVVIGSNEACWSDFIKRPQTAAPKNFLAVAFRSRKIDQVLSKLVYT